MNTEILIDRKQTTFRLREDRSLNNYVESALMDVVERKPNKKTLEAIKELREGKFAGTIDTGSMEAFIKSCE